MGDDPSAEEVRRQFEQSGSTVYGLQTSLGIGASRAKRLLREAGVEWESTCVKSEVRERRAAVARILAKAGESPPEKYLKWPALNARREEIRKRYAGVKKVLFLSDLHIPHQDHRALATALERDGDADLIVLGGDTLHMGAFGSFAIKDSTISFEEELETACDLLDTIRQGWDVVLIRANHERRLEKLLHTLPLQALHLVEKHMLNIVTILVAESMAKSKHGKRLDGIYDWWVQIGDAALCHADEFSGIPSRSVTNLADWFDIRKERFPGINVVVQAHTHHQSMVRYHGYRCIESGCLCHDQDYVYSGKLGAGKKDRWMVGYTVLEMEKGTCDVNRCRFVEVG